jgi:hypothetical protein
MIRIFTKILVGFSFVGFQALAQTSQSDAVDGKANAGTTETQDANASIGDSTAKPAKSTKHQRAAKKKNAKKEKKSEE